MAGHTRLQVLVVDDEPLIRWSLVEILKQAGHVVAEAADAACAIRAIASAGPFDVVVLDYRLPDSNDLGLLSGIRKLAPRTAVIMMTAFEAADVADGAMSLGAYRVMLKPFEIGDMAGLVAEAHAAAV